MALGQRSEFRYHGMPAPSLVLSDARDESAMVAPWFEKGYLVGFEKR